MPRPPMFQRATVTRVIEETADTRTFVLAPHSGPFTYQAGQFCTFRVELAGEELLRSYSMSSAPETDSELAVTVKRVKDGKVSNWMIDNLAKGDEIEMTTPHGVFCLRDDTDAPLLGFCGGSGITPVISLAKSALTGTNRKVRLLCADRDRPSAIFYDALAQLAERFPGRLEVVRHLDSEHGIPTAATIQEFVGNDAGADCYICGPTPFMDLVESAWPGPGKLFVERFGAVPAGPAAPETAEDKEVEGTVTIILGRKKISVPRRANETFLESARRGGLTPPFSCESGTCATCMAKLVDGEATMRVNEALTDDEVEDGYILTCQGLPKSANVTVRYE
ncbi:ferredoxin--NADP reductase [Frankia sp. CNm7]|uniref:Ferredoxin--NADP reductase n=1 Tax=Frankia nepalensis TaxID=1836974 RepID=A0A937URW4_9ACTN|nr:ferredoxin--NADP reductase [Frankia nepalensis]MBL7501256.1 ferredoxin--NADP reductase [Frankia nepalensis]MBL7509454.1 ferredoxin--NADP reductase [Frankia nepalensis]MBL7518414.1 ferredoxin--NADP reductase [Frankia nepalensis]MBL7631543.1 ferredoxin--NADP reductase [Frankia nepalensis]